MRSRLRMGPSNAGSKSSGMAPIQFRISHVILRLPGMAWFQAPDAVWSLPGNYPFAEEPLASSVQGQFHRESGWINADTGMGYVFSKERSMGLIVGYELMWDHALVRADEGQASLCLGHGFDALAVLNPGESVEWAIQVIRAVNGDREALRKAAQDLSEKAAGGPPQDRPAWLRSAVIAEMHPWGRLESWWAQDRGDRMPGRRGATPLSEGDGRGCHLALAGLQQAALGLLPALIPKHRP